VLFAPSFSRCVVVKNVPSARRTPLFRQPKTTGASLGLGLHRLRCVVEDGQQGIRPPCAINKRIPVERLVALARRSDKRPLFLGRGWTNPGLAVCLGGTFGTDQESSDRLVLDGHAGFSGEFLYMYVPSSFGHDFDEALRVDHPGETVAAVGFQHPDV
jgi:hypothetical protein